MKKRIITLLLVVSLIVGCIVTLTSCGEKTEVYMEGLYSESDAYPGNPYAVFLGVNIKFDTKGKAITDAKKLAAIQPQLDAITSFKLHPSTRVIADGAFAGCTNLKKIDNFNELTQLESIGAGAFAGCTFFENPTIPDNVKSIGVGAFRNCKSLTSVKLPKMLVSLYDFAFAGCENVRDIIFDDECNVGLIGVSAFSGCNKLNYTAYTEGYYLGSATNKYIVLVKTDATVKAQFSINSQTRIICESAFAGRTELQSIVIPDSVFFVGDFAFSGCTALNNVKIGQEVRRIGKDAFMGCTSLSSVEFLYNVGWFTTDEYAEWDARSGGKSKDVTDIAENVELFDKNTFGHSKYVYRAG